MSSRARHAGPSQGAPSQGAPSQGAGLETLQGAELDESYSIQAYNVCIRGYCLTALRAVTTVQTNLLRALCARADLKIQRTLPASTSESCKKSDFFCTILISVSSGL
eukprot:SAG25_NODE_759_length_5531_cov_2.460052_1_plen_107_part_00